MVSSRSEPDWQRFGLETQQPVSKPLLCRSDATDGYTETDSDENELFKEEQVCSDRS